MKKQTLTLGVVAFTTFILAGCSATQSPAQPEATPLTQSETTATSTPTAMKTASYKDGTYDVKGDYKSPAGPETIAVKLTLKENIVTDAEVTGEATNPKSKYMQDAFAKGFKDLVIGKNINEIKLEKVSGSSLTPMGFNDALEKIKTQAQTS